MLEDDRAILGNVLVEPDGRLGAAQQLRQGVVVVGKRAIARISVIMLDLERKKIALQTAALELVEAPQALGPRNDRLTACRRSRLPGASGSKRCPGNRCVYRTLPRSGC